MTSDWEESDNANSLTEDLDLSATKSIKASVADKSVHDSLKRNLSLNQIKQSKLKPSRSTTVVQSQSITTANMDDEPLFDQGELRNLAAALDNPNPQRIPGQSEATLIHSPDDNANHRVIREPPQDFRTLQNIYGGGSGQHAPAPRRSPDRRFNYFGARRDNSRERMQEDIQSLQTDLRFFAGAFEQSQRNADRQARAIEALTAQIGLLLVGQQQNRAAGAQQPAAADQRPVNRANEQPAPNNRRVGFVADQHIDLMELDNDQPARAALEDELREFQRREAQLRAPNQLHLVHWGRAIAIVRKKLENSAVGRLKKEEILQFLTDIEEVANLPITPESRAKWTERLVRVAASLQNGPASAQFVIDTADFAWAGLPPPERRQQAARHSFRQAKRFPQRQRSASRQRKRTPSRGRPASKNR